MSKKTIDDILAAAEAHGKAGDPEHEVGDLQDALRIAWRLMTVEQRQQLVKLYFKEVHDEGDEKPQRSKPKALGKLVIIRSSAMTGAKHAVEVFVDGHLEGEVANGARVTFEVPAGRHTVKVQGGGMSREVSVTITAGEVVKLQTYFSEFGIFGGGLNLKPA